MRIAQCLLVQLRAQCGSVGIRYLSLLGHIGGKWMPVYARTLEEPESWSRMTGTEMPDSPVGGPLGSLGASGLFQAGYDCCPLPGETVDLVSMPRLSVCCPWLTLCRGKTPMLCSKDWLFLVVGERALSTACRV